MVVQTISVTQISDHGEAHNVHRGIKEQGMLSCNLTARVSTFST